MERFFDIQFKCHKDLMKFLNTKLKPNEKLVSTYKIYKDYDLIMAIFERTNEKSHVHDYVVVNYNQKPETTITPTQQPFYCGGCTTIFDN